MLVSSLSLNQISSLYDLVLVTGNFLYQSLEPVPLAKAKVSSQINTLFGSRYHALITLAGDECLFLQPLVGLLGEFVYPCVAVFLYIFWVKRVGFNISDHIPAVSSAMLSVGARDAFGK